MNDIKIKFQEAISSILPIAIIMLIIGTLLGFHYVTLISLIISTILLIVGVTLFTYGADVSMIEIGKLIASKLVRTKKPLLIATVCFVVGLIITIAEPDLKVLAAQMTAIDSNTFILCVGVGVGLFLSLASIRIIFQINLKILIAIFYGILLLMLFISSENIIPVAFDSGGVTTGPLSVPFIIAMGLGFSSSRERKKSKEDSFGLVALCSIGPILIVLLFGLFMKQDMSYTYNIAEEVTSIPFLIKTYVDESIPVIKEVIMTLLPIFILFLIFNFITKKTKRNQFKKIISGLVITLLGISLFFLGVNVGYMPIAYLLGINLINCKWLLIPLGLIIGFVIVKAEPAVSVLTEQIEKITQGNLKKNIVTNTIAVGVALAVSISIFRVITGTSIIWILIVGYVLAILLMILTPKIFTMVAFDSGGAVTGPMTTSFLLPFIIGICYSFEGNVLTDAFGLVALVALSPLLTIQILGIIYSIKSKIKTSTQNIDETIIEYSWEV